MMGIAFETNQTRHILSWLLLYFFLSVLASGQLSQKFWGFLGTFLKPADISWRNFTWEKLSPSYTICQIFMNLWISVNSNTVCCSIKSIRGQKYVWRKLPRHFEITCSKLFFYVECSYLVHIKHYHSRICWYKPNYSPKPFSSTYVSISEGGVFQSLISQKRFLT